MKIFYGLRRVKLYKKNVVALGVFDGVHRAHQQILKSAVGIARRKKLNSLVLTFFPHPKKKESLQTLDHRLKLIATLGLDICIVIKFTREFSRIPAQDFIKDILCKKLKSSYILVGRNFRFGFKAGGDSETLKEFSSTCGYKIKLFRIIKINGRPVSSSEIRKLIMKADFDAAENLLSRPVSVMGRVVKGSRRGKKLGFPTANIDPGHEVLPCAGVYAVKIILEGKKYNGVCSIGARPTFIDDENGSGKKRKIIEVHIFDFNKNIYGRILEVEFIKKLRNQLIFKSHTLLIRQIEKDIIRAKNLFTHH
ncbi:MAG: hypothetical protein DRP74_03780 [Candidatus Omnitrophota bacterium]|nr:MAG: hypothetical protein DRP74_03780 [Candidatus Omnitrophota bacterium]